MELVWSPDRAIRRYFRGTVARLSSLLAAGRHQELLALLGRAPSVWWLYRQYGLRALVVLRRKTEAIRYAEASRGRSDSPVAIGRACEAILLDAGLAEEGYARYAIEANRQGTYLATFRALARKYPHRTPQAILEDLTARTPGQEGKWFAAARDAGRFAEAIALANRSPCDPRTLTRATHELAESRPDLALEAGLAALRWLVAG